ncbi:MAG: 6-carboxytetrahydropterin synthase QueD [Desulfarculales bacterium]|jgi:6-pyruvoyltetrahydropterin/6-carboxytetrahydropterin synthase|nr:6-carboxytetrahydropterin synthase QueD [Desulfarculales bacterium]
MYELQIVSHFSAAHQLRNFKGRCESLHGHNWRVEVTVQGNELDEADILLDFGYLKKLTQEALDDLDHVFLNDMPEFSERNPSSELIARRIFQSLAPRLPGGVHLKLVSVWESEGSRAGYLG